MPRVPLDLTPYHAFIKDGWKLGHADGLTLLHEVVAGRTERNHIARECSEQWDRADSLSQQLALAAPLIHAALELDSADALHDDPEQTSVGTENGLRLAREVFSAAVQNYLAGLTTNAVEL